MVGIEPTLTVITIYLFVLFLVAKQVEPQLYTHIYTIYYYVINKYCEAVEKTTCAYYEY